MDQGKLQFLKFRLKRSPRRPLRSILSESKRHFGQAYKDKG